MANKFNVFIIIILILLALIFGYISFNLNNEINKVKNEYATKNQVSEIIFQKIDSCTRILIRADDWDFSSDNIYARDVCQKQGKSCFTATMYAMESSSPSWNAFSKGNFGCSMPLSKSLLEDNTFESYEVVCC